MFRFGLLSGLALVREQTGQPAQRHLFPVIDLIGMNPTLRRNFSDRAMLLQNFLHDLGLELGTVPFPHGSDCTLIQAVFVSSFRHPL